MAFKNLMGKFLGKPEDSEEQSPAENGEKKQLRVQFFLCFPNQTEAGEVRDKLDALNHEVFLRLAEDFTNWLVVVTRQLQPGTTEFIQFEQELAALAVPSDGEYQGWEYETVPGLNLYSSD